MRVTAIGDLHLTVARAGRFRGELPRLRHHADVLLFAGDLTERGTPEQARCLAREVSYMGLPIVAVLGNHDHLTSRAAAVTAALPDAGVQVVDQTCTVPTVGARGWVWPA